MVAELGVMNGGKRKRSIRKNCGDHANKPPPKPKRWQA